MLLPGFKLRIALVLSSLLASACTVGEIPTGGNGGGGDDGSGSGSQSNGCVDRLQGRPIDKHPHLDGPAVANVGDDNGGMDCLASGCHMPGAPGTSKNGGVTAPEFIYGGTVYKGSDQTQPDVSAAVIFTAPGMAMPYATYTDTGGNFYIMKGDPMLPNPIATAVSVSACPNIFPMAIPLTPNTAGCGDAQNTAGGCHAKGGGPNTGIGSKIYLQGD
ncbi:MAG TPA: hypothetical protein VFP84_19355 [Kofleriaceae bacterium]|nr:hypothetical protein [Kofleriaceae bacterium]